MTRPSSLLFQRFFEIESAGSILLLGATLIAFAWANSSWAQTYHALWNQSWEIPLGITPISHSLRFWINEGLMVVFFLLVGLEIKRELLCGELASPRQAMLPLLGALGGMILPALIYIAFNPPGSETFRGWGIPMATDIAFATGILALFGRRVPVTLKVFLLALAILDDLGAILVIAVFYAQAINGLFLGFSGILSVVLAVLNGYRVKRLWLYLGVGGLLWLAMVPSGVHPTLSGVLIALAIPANPSEDSSHGLLGRLETMLSPGVSYAIIPVFALANAGVSIASVSPAMLGRDPVLWGIVAGLLLGKPLGILGAVWGGQRLGWLRLPEGVSWRALGAVSMLAGIGFTMSLFMTTLSFSQPALLETAKVAIVLASGLSGVLGALMLTKAQRSSA